MSTLPYPRMSLQDADPLAMQMSAQLQTTPIPLQHPMHAIVAPISAPAPKVDPMVAYEAAQAAKPATHMSAEEPAATPPKMSAIDRYENALATKQMSDLSKDENPYGSENNHPGFFGKVLHGLSVATGGPNRRLFSEQQRNSQIEGIEKNKSEQALQGAQTAHAQQQTAAGEPVEISPDQAQELEAPELAGTKVAPAVLATLYKQRGINTQKAAASQDRMTQQLRAHGYGLDPDGTVRPLKYEEMSPEQQSITDLRQSQQDLVNANAELKRSGNDPNSPAYKLAQQKLAIAKQGHDAAQTRANAMMMNAVGGNEGTDLQGNALPGAMLDANGKPVGSHFSANVRPTGQERNKADMAASADNQISDMQKIVQQRPDIFGPAAGRKTNFDVWIGSQDPDAQRFRAARTIAGDHLAGTFGGRSEAALNALDNAIGQFKDNPAAVQAGLEQLKQANRLFLQRGTVHTKGGNNSEPSGGGTGLAIGTIQAGDDGNYRFKGGDRYDQKNWEKVKK